MDENSDNKNDDKLEKKTVYIAPDTKINYNASITHEIKRDAKGRIDRTDETSCYYGFEHLFDELSDHFNGKSLPDNRHRDIDWTAKREEEERQAHEIARGLQGMLSDRLAGQGMRVLIVAPHNHEFHAIAEDRDGRLQYKAILNQHNIKEALDGAATFDKMLDILTKKILEERERFNARVDQFLGN